MNNVKSKSIILLIFFCMAGTLYATPKIIKPNKNQVVIVGRCDVIPVLNDDFYMKLLFPGEENIRPHRIQVKTDGNMLRKTNIKSILGDYFFLTYDLPKDRTITIPYFTLTVCGHSEATVYLPLHVKITVPEEQRYLYIGSFIYELADFNFMINDIFNVDEFEDASAMLNKALRKETPLYRAALQPISSEDSEEAEED